MASRRTFDVTARRYEAPYVESSRRRAGSRQQFGRITRAQLRGTRACPEHDQHAGLDTGYLIPILPGRLRRRSPSRRRAARLFSLVLFAGPGRSSQPRHQRLLARLAAVSRRCHSRQHAAPHPDAPSRASFSTASATSTRELINGIPCTTITQTLLDLAATEPPKLLNARSRSSTTNASSTRRRSAKPVAAGNPGSAALLKALNDLHPSTRSHQERPRGRVPLPLPALRHPDAGGQHRRFTARSRTAIGRSSGWSSSSTAAATTAAPPQRHRDQRKDAQAARSRADRRSLHGRTRSSTRPEQVARDMLHQIEQRRKLGPDQISCLRHGHACLRAPPDLAPGRGPHSRGRLHGHVRRR